MECVEPEFTQAIRYSSSEGDRVTTAVTNPISKTHFRLVSLAAFAIAAAMWHFLGRELAFPLTFIPGIGMVAYVTQKMATTPALSARWQIVYAIAIGLLLGAAYSQLAYIALKYHWL